MAKKVKVKTIDINAKEWFDKINGNSYFAGEVIINLGLKSQQFFNMPIQYGYGSQYEQEAKIVLMHKGFIPEKVNQQTGAIYPPSIYELKESGIIIRSNIQKNCLKKELKQYN